MSRSKIAEVEVFDSTDNDIIAYLPEHIKAICERLDALEETIRALSEHFDISALISKPTEYETFARVYLDGSFTCNVQHAGEIKTIHNEHENITVFWQPQVHNLNRREVRYGWCEIDGQQVTIAYTISTKAHYLTIYPGSVSVPWNKHSKTNGEHMLKKRVNNIVNFLVHNGWNILDPKQQGAVGIGRRVKSTEYSEVV